MSTYGWAGARAAARRLDLPWTWYEAKMEADRTARRGSALKGMRSTWVEYDPYDERVKLKYHGTRVVEWLPDGIRILARTGGYETITTRQRIHAFSGARVGGQDGSTVWWTYLPIYINEAHRLIVDDRHRGTKPTSDMHGQMSFPFVGDKHEMMFLRSGLDAFPDFVDLYARTLPESWCSLAPRHIVGPTSDLPYEWLRIPGLDRMDWGGHLEERFVWRQMTTFEPVAMISHVMNPHSGFEAIRVGTRTPGESSPGRLNPWRQGTYFSLEAAADAVQTWLQQEDYTSDGPKAAPFFDYPHLRAYGGSYVFRGTKSDMESLRERRVARIHAMTAGEFRIPMVYDFLNLPRRRTKLPLPVPGSAPWGLDDVTAWEEGVRYWLELEPTPEEAPLGRTTAVGFTFGEVLVRSVDPMVCRRSDVCQRELDSFMLRPEP